jgi:hypothetical protein
MERRWCRSPRAPHYLKKKSREQLGSRLIHNDHNLWSAVDEERDFGVHGRFDARARTRSWQLWLTQHRGALALVSLVVFGAIAAARRPSISRR